MFIYLHSDNNKEIEIMKVNVTVTEILTYQITKEVEMTKKELYAFIRGRKSGSFDMSGYRDSTRFEMNTTESNHLKILSDFSFMGLFLFWNGLCIIKFVQRSIE